MAVRADDGSLFIYALADGRELVRSQGPRGTAALAFSPDGRLLASAGADKAILLWEVPDGESAQWKAEDATGWWEGEPSAEMRRHVRDLLERIRRGGISAERLRALRAIEVLERIGTRQARQTLAELGGKDIDPALREEIRASLRRLDRPVLRWIKPDRDEIHPPSTQICTASRRAVLTSRTVY